MIPILNAVLPLKGILSWGFQRSPTHIHNGIDLPYPKGTPVFAAAAGHVTHASNVYEQGFAGYGRHIVIAHPGGVWTLYAHLDHAGVLPGESVAEGQQIGTVGNTAFTHEDHNATFKNGGFHLHFEVSPRPYPQASELKRLDPVAWLRGHPLAPGSGDAVDDLQRLNDAETLGDFLALGAMFLGSRWLMKRGKK